MSLRNGDRAVPFEVPDVDGNSRRLEDWKGHWVLLVFHRHLG